MPKITIEVTGNTATWLIDTARNARWNQQQLAATILDVARQLSDRDLLAVDGTPPTVDDNVDAVVELELYEGQRVFDPEGGPGVILRLFETTIDREPASLVLRTEAIDSPVDLSLVNPEDTFVWRQAELNPNV